MKKSSAESDLLFSIHHIVIFLDATTTLAEQFQLDNSIAMTYKDIVCIEILKLCSDTHKFKQSFPPEDLTYHYNLLEVHVTGNHIYIFAPFSSTENSPCYEVGPFPTYDDEFMRVTLHINDTLVLITNDLHHTSFPAT